MFWFTVPGTGRGAGTLMALQPQERQPCRLTMALIQIGAKGEVQPFETG